MGTTTSSASVSVTWKQKKINEALEQCLADKKYQDSNHFKYDITLNLEYCCLSDDDFNKIVIPDYVTRLNLSHNKLSTLPSTIPVSVRSISLEGNHGFGSLGDSGTPWFKYVRTLDLSSCGLSRLSFPLPPFLTYLNVSQNYLISIPEGVLPDTLTVLDVEGNSLTSLPILPRELEYLHAAGNKISVIPLPLPERISEMDFTNNYILSLPSSSNIPASLESFIVNALWLGKTMEDVNSFIS